MRCERIALPTEPYPRNLSLAIISNCFRFVKSLSNYIFVYSRYLSIFFIASVLIKKPPFGALFFLIDLRYLIGFFDDVMATLFRYRHLCAIPGRVGIYTQRFRHECYV